METTEPEVKNEFDSDISTNEDFLMISSALTVLQNQLAQAKSDLTQLMELKSKALQNPEEFVTKFINKNVGTIPTPQKILAIPHIGFGKYVMKGRRGKLGINYPYPMSNKKLFFDVSESRDDYNMFEPDLLNQYPKPNSDNTPQIYQIYDEPKAKSTWTAEEITRLEELLLVYPEEKTGRDRYRKISEALGTRTTAQYKKPGLGSRATRISGYQYLVQKATMKLPKEELEDDDHVNMKAVHRGFTCDLCGEDPIIGIRWACKDCPPDKSIDLCHSCHDKDFTTDTHSKSHDLDPIKVPIVIEQADEYSYLGL
ncbi:ZZ-type zinc finger-containing protein 3 [Globomyces sp. JEL0801]|nr:ZZ-type zinc finger-containing protein 3 [Globomyces sp. JEL0801]